MEKKFRVYKSSAGSGKTHTLVTEYLKLALSAPDTFRHILAITFTNKAAAEMKSRILQRLEKMSEGMPGPRDASLRNFFAELASAANCREEELPERAALIYTSILHGYSNFSVSTIDSFVHRIIRSFAPDLRLPQNFEVETDSTLLREQAVELLIGNAGLDETLTRVLLDFSEQKALDEKSWNIESELLEFSNELMKEDTHEAVMALGEADPADFLACRDIIRRYRKEFETAIRNFAMQAFTAIGNSGIRAESFFQGNRGIYAWLARFCNNDFSKIEPNSYVQKTVDEAKWYAASAPESQKAAIQPLIPLIETAYRNILDKLKEGGERYLIYGMLSANLYPMALLHSIALTLDELKQKNNILLISEFHNRIAEIVRKEPVPYIYERVGEKYRHFLIDEFQDTSMLQFSNLLPLIDNALASARFNMVVGDGKQAIYRWRNGDVQLFAGLPAVPPATAIPDVSTVEAALIRNYDERRLGSNFRSSPVLVNFFNKFFTYAAALLPPEMAGIYEGLSQQAHHTDLPGYVSVNFSPHNDFSERKQHTLGQIAEIIVQLRTAGFSDSDIAILCRTNKQASEVAVHLLQQGIQVISSESLLLGNSPLIRLLIALLRWTENNSDSISMLIALSLLRRHKGLPSFPAAAELIRMSGKSPQNATAAYSELLKEAGFDADPVRLRSMPLYELCESLIRGCGLNKLANPFLHFFLDHVARFSQQGNTGIADFLEWWEEKGIQQSVIVPEGADAVKVMTIHKSKGLQFAAVIYPFADQAEKLTKTSVWLPFDDPGLPGLKSVRLRLVRDLENTSLGGIYREESAKTALDLLNLQYVALTRAEQALFVLTACPPEKKEESIGVASLFSGYFSQTGRMPEPGDTFTEGEWPVGRKKGSEKSGGISGQDEIISEAWEGKLRFRIGPRPSETSRLRGELIHRALSEIHTAADAPAVIEKYSGFSAAGQTGDSLAEIVSAVVNHPELSRFFTDAQEVKTETDILLPGGKLIRPDRMVIAEDKVYVIDFKTGRAEETHKRQLLSYAAAVHQMWGKTVECLLVYTGSEIVIEKF